MTDSVYSDTDSVVCLIRWRGDGPRAMAITGLSAQELVHLARSAFAGGVGGAATAIVSAERAVVLGIFCNDGSTGDVMALAFIGNCLPFVEPCIANVMR